MFGGGLVYEECWGTICDDGDIVPGGCVPTAADPHAGCNDPKGLNSVCWVSLCLLRSTFLWKALPQRSQAKGLNPVCFRECVIKFELWLKAFPHTWHLWGFSPETNKIYLLKIKQLNMSLYIRTKRNSISAMVY